MLTPIEIKQLDWDTAFFGYKVAKLTISDCATDVLKYHINSLREQDFRLLYAFVNPLDIVSNTSCVVNDGFLADEKTTYSRQLLSVIGIDEHIELYPDRLPNEQLYKLALLSGEKSRFNIDPNIGSRLFTKLYRAWIENSTNKEIADMVLVYKNKGEIGGFVSLSIRKSPAIIGLIAVDPNYQGLNIGSALIHACINMAWKNNLTSIEVVTQKFNDSACRFYEKCGFTLAKLENIYHFWI
jgi:dTDP-4-amino-4,6-dideoxy-D-galactose acyltransferase